MFNYKDSTLDALVQHVLVSSRQTLTQAKKYYAAKGVDDVVEKINVARILAQQERIGGKFAVVQNGESIVKISSMSLLNMFWKTDTEYLNMTASEIIFMSVLITFIDNVKVIAKGVYEAYPSGETVQKRSGMSIKTIEKVRKSLKESGWLEIKTGKGAGNSNRYYINADKINEAYKLSVASTQHDMLTI